MKTIWLRTLILAGILAMTLSGAPETTASPGLSLSISPAPPGATVVATVALTDVSDIESFSLELSLGSGGTIQLPANGWFSRGAYFPASPFGSAPTVELNNPLESTAQTKVFIDGFKPTGTTGAVGSVSFTVNSSAAMGDFQDISLSGSYYSKSSTSVMPFTSTNAHFVVGGAPSRNLIISFAGTGSGTVTSTPAGVACNTNSTQPFSAGSVLTLHAAPAEYSLFTSWAGACVGSSNCPLTMDTDKSVTATFTKDSAHQVRLDGTTQTYHSSIISAYSAANSGNIIRVWGTGFSELFTFNQPKSVTIKGGYNQAYSANGDYTTLQGVLTVKSGALTVERLVIE